MEIPKDFFDKLVNMVSTCLKNQNYELEAKFNNFTPNDFTELLKYLRSTYKETIHEESLDISTNDYRISIDNKEDILEYCKTRKIPQTATFMKKRPVQGYTSLFLKEANSKIDLRDEEPLDQIEHDVGNEKIFRFKKRYTYTYEKYFKVDTTIVRSAFSLAEAITAPLKYEIEIELVRDEEGGADAPDSICKHFIKNILEISSVLCREDILISQAEKDDALQEYLDLAGYTKTTDLHKYPKKYFIGPQPITLEQKNIIAPDLGVISIRDNYTVTDKADGERMLLFVNKNGKAYMINSRLNIKATGIKFNSIKNTLFDGEYVIHKKIYS
jgi:hypothetical protein